MTGQEISNGLLQLGFNSGWAITGDAITLWENAEPQPTEKELSDAAKLWAKTQAAEAEAKASAKSALLSKLGITAEEATLLLS